MNELKSSNSAYLKHHAQNPIHWKTWSEKTLDTALSGKQVNCLKYWLFRMSLVSCYGERNI